MLLVCIDFCKYFKNFAFFNANIQIINNMVVYIVYIAATIVELLILVDKIT